MLMGEFHHNLDEKSRLIIPSKFRNELGEKAGLNFSQILQEGLRQRLGIK